MVAALHDAEDGRMVGWLTSGSRVGRLVGTSGISVMHGRGHRGNPKTKQLPKVHVPTHNQGSRLAHGGTRRAAPSPFVITIDDLFHLTLSAFVVKCTLYIEFSKHTLLSCFLVLAFPLFSPCNQW